MRALGSCADAGVVTIREPRQQPWLTTAAIGSCIRIARGQRVLLDEDLARLYGVPTKAIVQAVARNPRRFPSDFAVPLP